MNIKTSFENIAFKIEEGIGYLTLNRPSKLNALNRQTLEELKSLLTMIEEEKDLNLSGVIFTGEGEKAFIAGADIAEMADMTVDQAYEFGKLGQDVSFLLENLRLPIIAAVNGFALGGGCEMAMSCDFIYATENAVFGQPEVKLGLIPGYGGTQRLAKYVGRNLAKELIMSGRNMKAQEAKEAGLVLRIFSSKDSLMKAAIEEIEIISKNAPLAVSIAKKVINEGVDLPNSEGLQKELDQFSKIFSSDDLREGTQAFVEKRKPQFKGR